MKIKMTMTIKNPPASAASTDVSDTNAVPDADMKIKMAMTKTPPASAASTDVSDTSNSANDKPNNTQKDLSWQHVRIAKNASHINISSPPSPPPLLSFAVI
jgi:hypothetical protein